MAEQEKKPGGADGKKEEVLRRAIRKKSKGRQKHIQK